MEPAVLLFGGLAIVSTIGCVILYTKLYFDNKKLRKKDHGK